MAGFSEKIPYKLDCKNGFLEGKVETTFTDDVKDLDTIESILVVAKMSVTAVNKRSVIPESNQVDGVDTNRVLMDANIFCKRPTQGDACIKAKAPVDPVDVKAFKALLIGKNIGGEKPTKITINYSNA